MESILFYFSFLIAVILLSLIADNFYRANKLLQGHLFSFFIILFTSIVVGTRYGVGVDYFSYKNSFEQETIFGIETRHELLFRFLFHYAALFGNYISFFFWSNFLIMSCLFFTVRKNWRLLPYVYFVFFTLDYWAFSMNGIRQTIAVLLVILASFDLARRKMLCYILWIIIAFLFHKSAIVMIVFYFFMHKDWTKSIKIIYALILICFIFRPLQYVWDSLILWIAPLLGYEDYAIQYDVVSQIGIRTDSGLSKYLYLLIDLVLIYYSQFIKNKSNPYFLVLFNFYTIGLVLFYGIEQTLIVQRINIYFVSFRILIFAYVMSYLLLHKNVVTQLVFTVLLLLAYCKYWITAINGYTMFPYNIVFYK